MDDIYSRRRYSKYKLPGRKNRKNYNDEPGSLMQIIVKQTILCVLILGLIGIIKNVNTKPTNYISGKIKQNLEYNINPKNLYGGLETILGKFAGKNDDPFDQEAQPAGSIFDQEDYNNNKEDATGTSSITPVVDIVSPAAGYIAIEYGYISDPVTGNNEFHNGIDIIVAGEGIVDAAHDGEVAEVGSKREYGNYIAIKNGDIKTVYGGCGTIKVIIGQKVKQGDNIATVVGISGLSGAYLHFEIWKKDVVQNPLDYIKLAAEQ